MSGVTVTLCRSCPAGQNELAVSLRAAIGEDADLREVDCMSGCTRPSTVAFRAEGKTAYLFGDINEADIPNLVVFLRLYSASLDGNLADARPLGSLREKAIARIPG
jgi:predicted metal-binding protein